MNEDWKKYAGCEVPLSALSETLAARNARRLKEWEQDLFFGSSGRSYPPLSGCTVIPVEFREGNP